MNDPDTDRYDHVSFAADDGIGTITLDRPAVLNALTEEMLHEVSEVATTAFDRSDVNALVITGAGRGFCSGGDVREMEDRSPSKLEWKIHLDIFQNTVAVLRGGPNPVVAAVNGPAVGAGMDLALACDFRVMAEDAYFKTQFIDIGLVPGDGGGWLLPRLIGEARAKRYVMTNESITADVARELGLAYDVVPGDELESTARDLAATLRDKPGRAMAGAKALVQADGSFEEYCAEAIERQWACIHDDEHREAVAAFVGGREPNFDRPYE